MMKKIVLTTALAISAFTSTAFAQGGFVNNAQAVTTVSEAKNWRDDQYVVLQGKLIKQVGKEDFLFRDNTGEIVVEIDDKAWKGQQISPADEVKLYGEVDKSINKTEVEVHNIEKVK